MTPTPEHRAELAEAQLAACRREYDELWATERERDGAICKLASDRDHWKASHDDQVRRKREVSEKLSRWIRLFNRLEKAVSNHEKAKAGTGFTDDADDALHAAWRRVMRDACAPSSSGSGASR